MYMSVYYSNLLKSNYSNSTTISAVGTRGFPLSLARASIFISAVTAAKVLVTSSNFKATSTCKEQPLLVQNCEKA